MSKPKDPKPIKLSPEELAAIDAVAPYEPGVGVTANEAREIARKRTRAWMEAAEKTTTISA